MAWLDDRLRDHPKILRLTAPAFKEWTLALCYCSAHGTEGRLDEAIIALRVKPRIVAELVDAGLWDEEDDGLWVHDWQEHNERRDERIEEKRRLARERQAKHRDKVRTTRPKKRDVTRDSHAVSRVTERDVTRDSSRRGAPARDAGARDAHAPAITRNDHDQGEERSKPQPEPEPLLEDHAAPNGSGTGTGSDELEHLADTVGAELQRAAGRTT